MTTDYGSNVDLGGYADLAPGGSDYYDFGQGDVPYQSTNVYGSPDSSNFFQNIGSTLKNLFSGTGPGGDPAKFGAFLGLAGLANRSSFFNAPPTRVGYQGTIPQYTASRTQMPLPYSSTDQARLYQAIQDSLAQGFSLADTKLGAQRRFGVTPAEIDAAITAQPAPYRRPGAGGITYFSPMQYSQVPAAAPAPAPAPAPATDAASTSGTTRRTAQSVAPVTTSRTTTTPTTTAPTTAPTTRATAGTGITSGTTTVPTTGATAGTGITSGTNLSVAPVVTTTTAPTTTAPTTTAPTTTAPTTTAPTTTAPTTTAPTTTAPTTTTTAPTTTAPTTTAPTTTAPTTTPTTAATGMYAGIPSVLMDRARSLLETRVKQLSGSLGENRISQQAFDTFTNPEALNRYLKQVLGLAPSATQTPASTTPTLVATGPSGSVYAPTQSRLPRSIIRGAESDVYGGDVERYLRDTRGMAGGGIAMLAKGRYLQGNGDGVSDSIPAKFAGSGQPAALADGEFVIPARVVSELGNGSSDAGARKLYAMLDRVEQRARKAKRGKPSGADRELNKLA